LGHDLFQNRLNITGRGQCSGYRQQCLDSRGMPGAFFSAVSAIAESRRVGHDFALAVLAMAAAVSIAAFMLAELAVPLPARLYAVP
ncbi:MAG: hypothetical protein H6Q56_169, partial [Deltaproteobacteria bacterium]|nr:hypothetical protein [Deltaproteobacteria bacterium]